MANGNGTRRSNGNGNGRRNVDDWLTGYLEYTSEQESPSLFHLWVGLSVLASTLERRVWLDRGYYKLYPNMYIVLVGASARVRKTTAVNTGYGLFREALPNSVWVSQKVTPEALITVFVDGFKERNVSGGSIVSTELGVFLGSSKGSVDIMQLLTDWYDCPSMFTYHTQMRGKETMENVFCNMIGATTPQWLKDSLPPRAIGGGFTSRVVFVYQDMPEKLVAFPKVEPAMFRLKGKLMEDLQKINKMKGEYKLTKKATEWFEDWYTKVFHPETTLHASLDGYFGRKHDTLLKLAMLFAASRGNNRVVDEIEMRMALKAINENEKYLPQTLRLIQMTEVGEESEKVFRVIERRKKVDHTTLMRQLSYAINARRLEEVIGDLIACERIELYMDKEKRYYRVRR